MQTQMQAYVHYGCRRVAFRMLVMVRCVIFDGRVVSSAADEGARITHVREGQLLGAWRAVEGRIGFALLDISSMTMVDRLLREAFPTARHIDIEDVVSVSPNARQQPPTSADSTRQTGT